MKQLKIKILMMFVMLGLVFSCKTINEISYTSLASNYNPEVKLQIDAARIFHENDSLSRVFLQYNTAGFKYLKPRGKEYFRADYSISYQLFSSYESNTLIDERTFYKSDSLHYENAGMLKFDFPVAADFPGEYLLEVKISDLNVDQTVLYPLQIEKDLKNSSQWFLPVDEPGDAILDAWISWKTKFRIKCSDKEIKKLFVGYFKVSFPIASPPFSHDRAEVYDYEADKSFTVEIRDGISEDLQFANEGIYHFTSDEAARQGISLFRFEDYFPKVKKPEQLGPPLRYLTSNKEYEKLRNALYLKQAVDNFWIETAGNEDRAEALIKLFYGRVEQANKLFSSHKEGWKTDRGMIYIIFGTPKTVYKRSDIETWIYGEQGNRVFLTFDFVRAINPFTENDFELQRQPEFKEQWYNAVLFWRQ